MGRLFLFLKRCLNVWLLMFCGAWAVSDRKDTKLLKATHNIPLSSLELFITIFHSLPKLLPTRSMTPDSLSSLISRFIVLSFTPSFSESDSLLMGIFMYQTDNSLLTAIFLLRNFGFQREVNFFGCQLWDIFGSCLGHFSGLWDIF